MLKRAHITALPIVQRLVALRRLFRSYQGTSNEFAVRREQAAILLSVGRLFSLLGVGICLMTTSIFLQGQDSGIITTDCVIIALYAALLLAGRRWPRHQDDAYFISLSVAILTALGISWGILINLFAVAARPDQQGILIGLIMGLVSTPMLGVPVSAALAFFVPISGFGFLAALQLAVPPAAIMSFIGFLAFALIGLLYMNKTMLERSIGRLNLQKEHETIRVFLREYEEVSTDWLWETNEEGHFRDVSASMAAALRVDKAYLEALSLSAFLENMTAPGEDSRRLAFTIRERSAFRDARLGVLVGEDVRWFNFTGHPVYDEAGAFVGFRGIGSDITDAWIGQRKIEFLASHDGLTGLLNRQAFVDALTAACQDPSCGRFALLLIDLDDFKGINDDLGHGAGDEVLRSVADRLRTVGAPGIVAARIGGDEFAVLMREADEDDAIEVAEYITGLLANRVVVQNLIITTNGSVGIAMYPEHGTEVEMLMRRADLALYRAKERGKKSACLFEPEFEAEHLGRMRLQSELAIALENGEVFLHYQPIVDVRSGFIVSVEALVRWNHPMRGPLSAGEFMPGAEASDLIERLGEYVLRMACRAAAGWQHPIPVAVNLSPKQLRSGRFVTVLENALAESGLFPGRLSLEMTETVFLASSEQTMRQLDAVRALGVRIILDDFGTGYSSLTYLRGFEVDGIKIDQSFIRDLPGSQKVSAIVRTIGRLASDMNIYVVAEGVETLDQLKWLRLNGIPFAQGYFLGRPGEDTVFSGSQKTWQEGILSAS